MNEGVRTALSASPGRDQLFPKDYFAGLMSWLDEAIFDSAHNHLSSVLCAKF